MILQNINSFNPLDYENVSSAFRNINFNHSEMIVFSIGLGSMFAIFNIIRVSKPLLENGVDAALFFKLFKEYAHIMALIIFMPFAIEIMEYIFSEISEAYRSGFGKIQGQPIDLIIKQKEEATSAFNRLANSFLPWTNTTVIGTMLDNTLVFIIKPFFTLIDNWSYGLALTYRFIYLGALKLIGGAALACYIYEPTRHYFYTWVKNLLISYLLIPGFLFVTVFIDAIRSTYLTEDNYQLGILIICLMAKIAGYAQIQRTLQNSL